MRHKSIAQVIANLYVGIILEKGKFQVLIKISADVFSNTYFHCTRKNSKLYRFNLYVYKYPSIYYTSQKRKLRFSVSFSVIWNANNLNSEVDVNMAICPCFVFSLWLYKALEKYSLYTYLVFICGII